jgi:hypothetical protein
VPPSTTRIGPMFVKGIRTQNTIVKSQQGSAEYPLFPPYDKNDAIQKYILTIQNSKQKRIAIVHSPIQFVFCFCDVSIVGSTTTPVTTFTTINCKQILRKKY